LSKFYAGKDHIIATTMRPIAFLLAVKHYIDNIKEINYDEKDGLVVVKTTEDVTLEFDIEVIKIDDKKIKSLKFLDTMVPSMCQAYSVDRDEDTWPLLFSLEQWLLNSSEIQQCSALRNNDILSFSYRTFRTGSQKVKVTSSAYNQGMLESYFYFREGYSIRENPGEGEYLVDTPSRNVRQLSQGKCSCNTYRWKRQCPHLQMLNLYLENKRGFVLSGLATLGTF